MTMPTTCRNRVSRTYSLLVSGIDSPWLVQILISIGAVYVKIGTLIVYFQMILYLYQSIYFLLFYSTQVNSSLLQVTTLKRGGSLPPCHRLSFSSPPEKYPRKFDF